MEFDNSLHKRTTVLVKFKKEIAEKLEIDLSEVEKTTSTYAWDICRAVNMARRFYFSNYLTEDEMWKTMKDAVSEAESFGTGWTDYSISFLLGRAIHGFGMNDFWTCEELLKGKPKRIKDIDVYQRYAFK